MLKRYRFAVPVTLWPEEIGSVVSDLSQLRIGELPVGFLLLAP